MNAEILLQMAHQTGVTLYLEDGSLRYRGKSNSVRALLPAIREQRGELIAILAENDSRSPLFPPPLPGVQQNAEPAAPEQVDPEPVVVPEVDPAKLLA